MKIKKTKLLWFFFASQRIGLVDDYVAFWKENENFFIVWFSFDVDVVGSGAYVSTQKEEIE